MFPTNRTLRSLPIGLSDPHQRNPTIPTYRIVRSPLKGQTNKSTKIIAISKNHSLESVMEAISSGVNIFGENKVQEAQSKFHKVKDNNPKIELHLTGPLQSNKVKTAITLFDVFHTLDRLSLIHI